VALPAATTAGSEEVQVKGPWARYSLDVDGGGGDDFRPSFRICDKICLAGVFAAGADVQRDALHRAGFEIIRLAETPAAEAMIWVCPGWWRCGRLVGGTLRVLEVTMGMTLTTVLLASDQVKGPINAVMSFP